MTVLRTRRSLVVAAAMLLLALFVVPSAAAVSVPITIKTAGTFEATPGNPSPCGPFPQVPITDTLTGTSSHLGQISATYPHCVNFASGMFTGTATFVAANGDELIVLLSGHAKDNDVTCATTTGICVVDFTGTITGGTGRFVGAEGSLTGTGTVNLNPGVTTVESELTGTINKNP